jgi:cytochrome c-type biogenesis protein CcmE
MKKTHIALGAIVIALFVAYGANSFRKTLTPYVSFEEARRAGRMVQIAGALVKDGKIEYHAEDQTLRFTLVEDSGDTIDVIYHGSRPMNFEDAESVVVIGRYEDGAMRSERLLVKCPSKYQGKGRREYPAEGA